MDDVATVRATYERLRAEYITTLEAEVERLREACTDALGYIDSLGFCTTAEQCMDVTSGLRAALKQKGDGDGS